MEEEKKPPQDGDKKVGENVHVNPETRSSKKKERRFTGHIEYRKKDTSPSIVNPSLE